MAGLVRAAEHGSALGFGTLLSLLAIVTLDDARGVWAVLGVLAAALILPTLVAFTFPGWVAFTRRTMVFGIVAPVGFLLPLADSLVFPRPLDVGGAWGILALTLVFGTVCDEMLRLGLLLCDVARTHPWVRRAAPIFALIPFLAIWGIFAEQRRMQYASRMEMAAELVTRLWENYPHWRKSPVTPWQLWAKYRPLLEDADAERASTPGPCEAYLRNLRDMFAELRNGHTEVLLERDLGMTAVRVEPVEGRAVITHVEPNSDAEAAGIRAGTEILLVDGLAVEDAIRRVPSWRLSFTSPRMRTFAGYAAMLDGPAENTVGITVRAAGNSTRVVRLERSPIRYEWQGNTSENTEVTLAPAAALPHRPGFAYAHLEGFEKKTWRGISIRSWMARSRRPAWCSTCVKTTAACWTTLFMSSRACSRNRSSSGNIARPAEPTATPAPSTASSRGRRCIRGRSRSSSTKTFTARLSWLRTHCAAAGGPAASDAPPPGKPTAFFALICRERWRASAGPTFVPRLALRCSAMASTRIFRSNRTISDVRSGRDAALETALDWLNDEAARGAAGERRALARLTWRSGGALARTPAMAAAAATPGPGAP